MSEKHPLTARVLANRIWLLHFGRGIVGTAGDFGQLGERPTHPELLDWLAHELITSGWKLKSMHRLLMTSSAYRQVSTREPEMDRRDPDNRLYSRMSVRRLEAEIVRDALLAVSGKLIDKLYGPPVPVMLDEDGQVVVGIENLNGEKRPDKAIPLNGEEYRRSVYVQVRRSRPLAVMEPFDLPSLEPNCTARNASTVAPQSLLLMNGQFTLEMAKDFATRLANDAGPDGAVRVNRAYLLAFGRLPQEDERAAAIEYLKTQAARIAEAAALAEKDPAKRPDADHWALATLCQALVSSNEFLYVE